MRLPLYARLAVATMALAIPAVATAQDMGDDKAVRGAQARDGGILTTPVDDLNIDGDAIPEVLDEATMDAYASEKLASCSDIERELLRLNTVLGEDFDLDPESRSRITAGRLGKTVAASFIPFRGLIREVTGAAKEERQLQEAIVAGATRRGYLKGLGHARGCAYPARPAMVTVAIEDEAETIDMTQDEVALNGGK